MHDLLEKMKKHHLAMMHRVILGSVERFIGILIEEFDEIFLFGCHQFAVIINISQNMKKKLEKFKKNLKVGALE